MLPPGQSSSSGSWFGRKRREAEQQRVNESVEELFGRTGIMWTRMPIAPPEPAPWTTIWMTLPRVGRIPQDQTLVAAAAHPESLRSSSLPPRSTGMALMYSYRFRPGESSGQVDNIYAPRRTMPMPRTPCPHLMRLIPLNRLTSGYYSRTASTVDAAYSSSATDSR
jgi:hypothetical protein